MARYPQSPTDLPTSTAGMLFRTRVTILSLCRSALSCRKSSYPLMVKRCASVRLVSWTQMMSTTSLCRNSFSSGFFFLSPQRFTGQRQADRFFSCCLVFSSWFLVLSLFRRSARCPKPSLPTSEQLMVWAWYVLLLDCVPRSTSYRVQSTWPIAPGWEYIWPLGHVDLLRPGRWLRLAALPPSGAEWTPPPHEV